MNKLNSTAEPEIITKSSIVYSQRRGANYGPSDEIEIYIPPSIAILNPKDTFLSFKMKMTGKLKKCWGLRAGAYSAFRVVTIYDGSGQYSLEQLPGYAQFDATRSFYTQNESLENLRQLHEGKPNTLIMRANIANQYVNGNQIESSSIYNEVECLLPIYNSGILSPNRTQSFPNLATNGLRIRINLNDADTACTLMTVPLYSSADDLKDRVELKINTLTSHGNYPELGGGGYSLGSGYECAVTAAVNATQFELKNFNENLDATSGCLSANRVDCSHVFVVGQTISIFGQDNDTKRILTGVSVSDGTTAGEFRIKLTVDQPLDVELAVGGRVCVDADLSNSSDESFSITDAKIVVGYTIPPKGYVEDVLGQISSGGGLVLDIKTYQSYPVNISANSLNNSLYLNSRNSRALSILCVPFDAGSNSIKEDSFIPDRQTVKDYQMVLYNVLTPDKRVNLQRYNLQSWGGVALREQMHSLSAGGIPVNNIKNNYKHFFIGRRLAMKGYSYNMAREGEVRININYSQTGSILMENYVVCMRRLNVLPSGIEIVY